MKKIRISRKAHSPRIRIPVSRRVHSPRIRIPIFRRPLCLFVLLYLLCLLFFQLVPSGEGPDLTAADQKHMTVSGRVLFRETNASGYRLLLGDITFPQKKGGGAVYRRIQRQLTSAWPSIGKISVFLNAPSEGSASVSVYGEKEHTSVWVSQERLVDQSDIYKKARIGTRVTFSGKTSLPDLATNPGQFDARSYNRARGIYLTMSDVQLEGQKPPAHISLMSLWLNFLTDLRFLLKQSALAVFGSENCALIDAIVLGDRSGLDAGTRALFQDGGILHILAVSSLHVTFLGMSLYRLLRRLRRSFLFSSVCSGFLVLSFCLMTGSSFSAVRATVMFFFWLAAQVLGRTCDRLTALAFSALMITVRHPYALTDTGFLLSFSCILSIELLGPVFEKIFAPKDGIPRSLVGSLALQTGILPLTLYFFYQATPLSPLLNLIVIPCMSLFLIFGVLGCLAGLLISLSPLFLVPAKLVAGPCAFLLDLFRLLCRIARALPFDVLVTGRPPLWKMFLYYSVLFCGFLFTMKMSGKVLYRNRRKIRLLALAALTGLFLLLVLHKSPAFRFTCLDIGQGSCNLVEQDGSVMLFDGGSSSVTDVYRYRIESTLKYYGISRIDLVFLSHGDIDHISGIDEMLDGYHPALLSYSAGGISVGKILVPDLSSAPKEYSGLTGVVRKAEANGIPVFTVRQGAKLSLGKLELAVLSPSEDRMCGDTNQDCIVLQLRYGKLRILFPGDLEKEGEEKFAESFQNSTFFSSPEKTDDILIAGHHGSRNATGDALLSLASPDLVLISCGKNNRYGHPSNEVLARLKKRHIPFHRTDRKGAFVLTL